MFAHCNYNVAQRYTLLSIYDKMYKNGEVIYPMCSIGEKLKTLRKGRKLTQQELSEKLGLSRATYSFVETGQRGGTHEFWQAIQDVFNVPDEDMYALQKLDKE